MNTIFAKHDMHTGMNKYNPQGNISDNTSEVRAAIYCRLSKDDGEGIQESSSIQTQRTLLEQYCSGQGWEVVAVYQDDGFTGLNMNRKDLQRMLKAIERKQIDVVLTKDLSRLSRNYVDTGYLLEEFFPKNGVRYLAVNDSIDTEAETAFDMTPFRAVMNQLASADTSKRVHSAYVTKARQGSLRAVLRRLVMSKTPTIIIS